MKMCRAIVFPVSLPKLSPKSGSSTGFSWPWVPLCTLFTTQMYFATGMFVFVFFARCFPHRCIFASFLWQQGQRTALPPRGQPDSRGSWPAPQGEFPRLPKARGLLRRRTKLVTRRGPVGSGSLGAPRIKTAFLKDSMRWECYYNYFFLFYCKIKIFFHRFVVIVHPPSHPYLPLASLLLLSAARERLWSNPEQHCHEVQEERQASSHGEEQGTGPPFLLQNLAQDFQTHWLCHRWVALCLCSPRTSGTLLIICEQWTTVVDFFSRGIGAPSFIFIVIVNTVWPQICLLGFKVFLKTLSP